MHTYQYLLLLAATTALAAPVPQRDAQRIAKREVTELNLSSHTVNENGNGITDHAAAAPVNFDLPPLAVVFAIMAEHPDSDSNSLSSPATASAHTIEMGPGLWLAPSPTPADRTEPTVSSSPDSHDVPPALTHKFLFVSIVILSMIALVLALYACSYHRHKRVLNSRVPLDEKALKDRKSLSEKKEQEREKKRSRSTSVVNITRNFPRSKFSVTSSDYALSVARANRASGCSSDSSSSSDSASSTSSEEASGSDCDTDESLESYERSAMDSAHFFALRASSTSSNNRHSRIGSEPVFGIPRYNARRAGRRTRSVSGPRESEEWA
ncbi:hypothetical protein C8F04DRAFT_1103999 [Mycena alexandri]|uniref:Uncharacterized protein n=1 Tax=Mycena alexandri TaxID=1745969 RepID=A0AAD6SV91_9AGAR|nr:hypothetical protein C8F04DRAFT_1103999 [Mycena alexandri]